LWGLSSKCHSARRRRIENAHRLAKLAEQGKPGGLGFTDLNDPPVADDVIPQNLQRPARPATQ
jgi:hypothetical protein